MKNSYFFKKIFFFRAKNSDISSPPGYNISIGQSQSEITKENDQNQTLIIKKSWEIALGPIKQVSKN
jgi:ER membrane protein complex subunit 4